MDRLIVFIIDDGDPVWIVSHGSASVMKLAHDEAYRALSPGTLLTAQMIAALLEEGVATIDFGRGDDPYKRLWAGERRQRIGLILANPRRPAGLLTLFRHDLGRMAKAASVANAKVSDIAARGSTRRRIATNAPPPSPKTKAAPGGAAHEVEMLEVSDFFTTACGATRRSPSRGARRRTARAMPARARS